MWASIKKTQSKICGRKVSAGGARAAIALAQIGPMPGTVISLRDTTGPDRFQVMVGARRWGRLDQQAKQRAPDTHCAAMVNVP
jgi:hypothetical protein